LSKFLRESIDAIASPRGIDVDFDARALGDLEAKIDTQKLWRTLEVLFDFSDANSEKGKIGISCKRVGDHWALAFRFTPDGKHVGDSVRTSENRREIDRLLLKRFCLLQNANWEILANQGEMDETVVHLEFRSP
jgi:hypothetical protein